ncbi:RES family NAD+ phosphorylase [Pseudovibrio sp. Tun.PSC04-5.I4]|uniref:RES family NAD+ phosphorylase n=1 Tax=Pseudovibrio sp. Tun.PSC04-5.I4 TaxID=1798213 RepID=UPI00088ACDF7|nr:RES family NAD+ phosphorylase [Pseudovibrio sp. Tun.PSC04-5.I4]SDR47626.1 RES domain-containing protein [Pseudovibrio sp. Tun.PSC04-5.I4]
MTTLTLVENGLDAPTVPLRWPRYYRLVNSAYPPIDLFEDIANPADWELLAAAESRTNPRLAATIGNLDKVPVERRVNGAGASYLMAPFTHASQDRPGRFHDGTFGAFYAAKTFETALFETVHHTGLFYAATDEAPGWIAQMRELIGSVDAKLADVRDKRFEALHAPDDYRASQNFARRLKELSGEGIIYPSARDEGGLCIATFYPDVVVAPAQARHFSYHWNGSAIDMIKDLSTSEVFAISE